MSQRIFLVWLGFAPAALLARLLGASEVTIFFLSSLAIVPLAKFIGDATEELAAHTNPTLGGFLNATFGNATELIIGILGIRAGLLEVVKASITGSILGNLLLVLGAAMIAGGSKYPHQRFNKTAAKASASTLVLGVIALVIPALFMAVAPSAGAPVIEELSVAVSVLMIIAYGCSLLFSLRTHKHLGAEDSQELHLPAWSKRRSIITLLAATAAVSVVSELLVHSIEPIVARFGWTELFIGVVFVALIGNAAEHSSAIIMARKNRMGLALGISIGSATQIAMFVAPVLVLCSLLCAQPMSLVFNSFELITIFLSVWIAKAVVEDGESNWFEGVQLLVAYSIMALGFYFFR